MLDNDMFNSLPDRPVPSSIKQKINLTLDHRLELSQDPPNTWRTRLSLIGKRPFEFMPKPAIGFAFGIMIIIGGAFQFFSFPLTNMNQETVANVNAYIEETMVDYEMPEFDTIFEAPI